MIHKIKLGTTLAALIIFFLPWIDISCSQHPIGTQSGIQMIYGGASPAGEMKDNSSSDKPDDISGSFLVGIALLVTAAAAFFAWKSMMQPNAKYEFLSNILPAAALAAVLLQLIIGIPVKNDLLRDVKEKTATTQNDPLGDEFGKAMLSSIQFKYTTAFYLELAALAFPTLLLLNTFIDKKRNS